ncbi:MAG: hypothetical protein JWO06_2564 [Bacteroidota bacterium]|nr:hypothetical protein [Bacteroidota bacterium]
MKQHAVLFIVFAGLLACTSCNQKAKRAKVYYDTCLRSVQVVIDSSLEFGDGIISGNKTTAMQTEQHYAALVNKTITSVQAQKDFEGDTTMQHYSMEMLLFYKNALEKDFSGFLSSIKLDTYTQEETHTADSLYQDFTMTENKYWDRFNWAEKKFYKENNLAKVDKAD